MTKAYSLAFKRKMIERLTGRDALSPSELGREIGIRQQNLSRWLHEARSLPSVASRTTPKSRIWTVEQKARALADASKLSGEELPSYLEREGIKLADFERWRIALEEDGGGSAATLKRIRKLERELARKEKALAEAAVLLVLKKTIDSYYKEEDDDTDEPSER
jgi:transposase